MGREKTDLEMKISWVQAGTLTPALPMEVNPFMQGVLAYQSETRVHQSQFRKEVKMNATKKRYAIPYFAPLANDVNA